MSVRRPSKPGYTLLEFLLYIGIVSGVLLVASNVLFTLLQGKAKLQAVEEVSQNVRVGMDRMSGAVRNAASVTTPAVGATGTSLILQNTSATTSPTTFVAQNGILYMKEGAAATTTLMSNDVTVRFLQFTNVGGTSTPATIRIELAVSSTNPGNDPNYEFGVRLFGTANVRR
ncbi:hypothetical protein HY479_00080 [Candidatus Uhrbacteria bacterium]|nr:hypothetical protein [Candidatus Uhrbacteria bacterium]